MKAITLNSSLKDSIEFTEVTLPPLPADQAKVAIKAAALNHRDEWCRQGLYPNIKNGVILGSDASGIVVEVGSDVDEKWIGKEVIINPAMNWGDDPLAQSKSFKILGMPDHGTLAEFVQVQADRLHEKPNHMNFESAAALPLAGVTAYRAVFVQGDLQEQQRVLVTGFGGGVAQMAVQFALAAKAEVYVSSSSQEKIDRAKKMGVSGGFNYTDENWSEMALAETGGFDLIIDSAMGETLEQLIQVARPGGKIVFYGATKGNPKGFDVRKVFWSQIKLIGTTMGNDADFANMLAYTSAHAIVPIIDQVFQMDQAVAAFDLMRDGKQMGKLVIEIDGKKAS